MRMKVYGLVIMFALAAPLRSAVVEDPHARHPRMRLMASPISPHPRRAPQPERQICLESGSVLVAPSLRQAETTALLQE